jgi:hypothetical protein
MPVYSGDRVRRLRMVLWIVAGIGVFVGLLAVVTLVEGDHNGAGVAGLVVTVLLLGSSGTTLRLLPDAERPAKVATVVTGALCLVSGVVSGSWVAFLLLLMGLGLVFLALIPDEPEGAH